MSTFTVILISVVIIGLYIFDGFSLYLIEKKER